MVQLQLFRPMQKLIYGFFLYFLLTSSPVWAATLTVTNGNDTGAGSLRNTIAAANSGDVIIFSVPVTTVTLTSAELLIDKNLTINGGTNGVTITRSGATQFRIFSITGGVTVSMSKLTITNGNHASQAGGIQNNGTLTMTDCTVSGNTSPQAGGIENDAVLTLTNCTLNNNTSTGVGGALVSYGTTNTLTNCTIANNQSSGHGGGFHIAAGDLSLINCTVAGNQSTSGIGGGIYVGGTALLKNTIVSGNSAPTSSNIGGNNVSSSSFYNLVGSNGSGGLTNGSNGNIVTGASAQLDVLANNGGYTQTMALLSTSPALDKGDDASVTTDQRGQTRPFDLPLISAATSGDNSDIGAYEVQVTCNTVTLSPTSLPNGTIGVGYTKTITASGGTAPYVFTVIAGSLPTSLSLASDGTLTGIPTATGTFNFTVTATYTTFGINCVGSRAYTIIISNCPAAVTFTVNNSGDGSDINPGNGICAALGNVCTLRAAIEEINALAACNNTINFSVTGIINLSAVGNSTYGPSALLVDRKIIINGNGITLQPASGVTRLRQFYVSPYGNLTLNDVTLQNGKAVGGNGGIGSTNGNGQNAGGAAGLGGAIFNDGDLFINRSTLTGNLAQGGNGGSSTVFVSPAGGAGGGGMGGDGGGGGSANGADGGAPNGGLGATASGAGGNGGTGGGGGGGKGTGNGGKGGFGGGGGASGSGGFGGNGGFGGGGGSGSSAGGGNNRGGFGANDGGGNTEGGAGAAMGGALFNNYQGSLTITNSTLAGNTVTGGTGGYNQTNAGDVAFAYGSGLFNRNGTVTVINSTINESVYNLGTSNDDYSGGPSRTGGTLTLLNTLISTCNNSGGTVVGPLANRNLIQNNTGCDTPYLTGDPNLSALQNNGGLTKTLMLLQPSIAIDAGDNSVLSSPYSLTADQTGKPRQANSTVDIGAFESQLVLNPATLPNAQASAAYSQTITATGGTSPYTFSVTGGTLPTGLVLSSGGVLSGTPSPAGGPFAFEVTATDNGGKKGGRLYNTITICGTISATPSSLTDATFGNGYTQTLTGTGGTAPYSFSVTGGSLPGGMALASLSTIQGSPTTIGTSNFTLTLTDVNGCVGTKAYSVNVNTNPCTTSAITVTSTADSGPGTLREAITDICGGGTITIQPGLGTINLSIAGDFSFGPTALAISNKAVTINGNGAIIQRDNIVSNLRIFYINATGNLVLQNITLKNGLAKGGNGGTIGGGGGGGLGGAIVNQGNLTVENSTLSNNQAMGGNGGAGGSNSGAGGGGGFGGNGGNNGGGGGGRSGAGANGGTAGGAGGQPAGGGGTNGTAGTGAGGGSGGAGNTGGGGGGTSGSASGSSGNGGAGGFGGGGGGAGGSGFGLSIGTSGAGGFGGGGGGGGHANSRSNSGADGGFAGGGGGGGANNTGADGGFAGGQGGNNSGAGGGGGGLGGGIYNHYGSVRLINSTLSANTAQGGNGGNGTTTGSAGGSGYGGGIFNYNGAVSVVAVTISNNAVVAGTNGTPTPATLAEAAGGGIYNLGDASQTTFSLINSILANSSSGATDCSCTALNGGSNAISGNNSLIENNNGCSTPALSDDPNLGALADNGGLTFTHALQTGSPAIDAGDNTLLNAPYSLTTDQRGPGFVRQYDGTVDIGAFESQIVNSLPTITGFAASPNVVCAGTLATFTATVGNVTGAYDFTLTNDSGPLSGTANTATFSQTLTVSGSGLQTYTLTVSENGASTTATTLLTVNVLPAATLTSSRDAGPPSGTLTCAQTSLTLTATGGTSYTFAGPGIVSQSTSGSASINASGTYSVTVTDANGCSMTNTTTISQNTTAPPASVSSVVNVLDCNTTVITLRASGGGTYLWSNGQTTATRNVNIANTYSVTVTGANGCTNVASKTIPSDTTPPIVSLAATDVCVGQSVTLTTVSGLINSTYVTPSGTTTFTTLQTGTTVSGLAAGTYSFTIIGRAQSNGCINSATATATVNALPTPTLTAGPSSTLTCATTSLTLTASGGTSYTFAGTGLVSSDGMAGTAVVNQSGTYSVTAMNASGCTSVTSVSVSSGTATVTVTRPSVNTAILSAVFSQTFTATGGVAPYTFSLVSGTLPTGLTLGADGVLSGTPSQTGTFTVTVWSTDQNSCSGVSSTYSLTVLSGNPTLTGFAASATTVCSGNIVTFTATVGNVTGSYAYTLISTAQATNNTISSTAFSETITVSGSNPQTVTLIASDNGFSQTATVNLTVNPLPSAFYTSGPSFTITQGNTLTITAVSPGNSFRWSTGATTATIINTPTVIGNALYSLTLTTPAGCTRVETLTNYWVIAPVCYSVVHVTVEGGGLQNGSSWANAYPGTMLQTAINSATACSGQVWIAAGLYKPTSYTGAGSRNAAFQMQNNVAIYGGFAGTETTLTGPTGRTLTMPSGGASQPSSTTFSGNIDNDNTNTNNSYHVVVGSSLNSTARLDGVVITGGNADNNLSFANLGGGIFLYQSISPVLANCTLESNTAVYGGGIMNYIGNPVLINCVLQNNRATSDGGGMSSYLGVGLILTNCVLQNNSAASGGGLHSDSGRPVLTNCTLQSNSATAGGTIGITGTNYSLTLTNSIVWNNGVNSFSVASGSLVASYSLFDPSSITAAGVISGPGNLTTTVSPFASTTSVALNACTPAINAGNNSATGLTGIATDLVGNIRVFGGTVDMGAVEFQGSPGSFTTTLTAGPSNTLTCSQTSLTLTATGGTAYTFAGPGLSQSGNSATAVVNQAGTYSVTAMNASGCISTTSTTINNSTAIPALSLSTLEGFVCGTTLPLTAIAGLSSYTFTGPGGLISAGTANTATANNVPGGPNTFTVVAQDANGCRNTAVASITLNQFPTVLQPIAQTVCAGSVVSFTSSATGYPTPTAQWRVSTDGGNSYQTLSGVTSPTLTFVASLTDNGNRYRVTYTNGCGTDVGFGRLLTVIQPVGLSTSGILSCTQTSLTLTATSGQTSYTFGNGATQQGGSAGNTAVVSASGLYGVTALSGEGCVSSATVLVQSDVNTPTVSIAPISATLTCALPSLTLTATSSETALRWSTGATSMTLLVNATGTYAVTATGANGCTVVSNTVVVESNTALTGFGVTTSASVCAGAGTPTGSVTLTANGCSGGTVNWPGGLIGNTYSTSVSGTYTATCTVGTCSTTASGTATVGAAVTATLTATLGGTLTCAVIAVTLTASGGGTYAFTGTGIVASSGSSATVNQANTFSVVVTGGNGCTALAMTTVQSDTAALGSASLSASNSNTLTCAVTSLTLTASATGTGLSYAFSGPGTLTGSGATRTINTPGTYTVAVTGSNGCTTSATTTVSSNTTAPTLTVTPGSGTLTCSVTSLTLTAAGTGTSYRWTDGTTGATLPLSASGTYSVTATGSNGCTSTTSVVISQSAGAPTPGIVASGSLSCGNSTVTLTGSGGNNYAFSGTGASTLGIVSQSGNQAVVNQAGPYSLTVTNTATGCFSTTSITVTGSLTGATSTPALPSSASTVCENGSVRVAAVVSGTVTGYQWYRNGQLVSGQSSATLSLAGAQAGQAGSYVLVVTSGCGSATSTAFVLTVNPLPTVSLLVPNNATVQGATITLPAPLTWVNFQVLGGVLFERLIVIDRVNGFEIRQVDSNGTGIFPINRNGPFRLTVTDVNGCKRAVEGTVVMQP